jgi:hypothetical protein
MEQELVARGLKQKLMKLDNEASKLLKTYLHQQDITFQLVPPYIHRRNSAERAIRSFKDHLIAGLCSTDKSFPMHLWDILLPQAHDIEYAENIKNQSQTLGCNAHFWAI